MNLRRFLVYLLLSFLDMLYGIVDAALLLDWIKTRSTKPNARLLRRAYVLTS